MLVTNIMHHEHHLNYPPQYRYQGSDRQDHRRCRMDEREVVVCFLVLHSFKGRNGVRGNEGSESVNLPEAPHHICGMFKTVIESFKYTWITHGSKVNHGASDTLPFI
jgi:hypothetical protein